MKLRIKEVAKMKGVQLQELAKSLKITRQRLHAITTQKNVELHTLEKVAKELECDPIELIEPESPELIHVYNRETNEYKGIIRVKQ